MESVEEQMTVVYVANLRVWEVDDDSFCVGGRRFFAHDHGLQVNDTVRVTITKVHPNNNHPDI